MSLILDTQVHEDTLLTIEVVDIICETMGVGVGLESQRDI